MLRTLLVRKNERAAYLQGEVRGARPRSYRDPVARPIILANRINLRRYLRGNGTDPLLTPVVVRRRKA